MTGTPPRRRFTSGPPALASLLLHVGAALALAALHRADPLPTAAPERGVEIVWQDNPEDAAPGEGAEASPESAEATSQESPAEPEQESAQAPPPQPPPPPSLPEAAPEEPRPEPSSPPLEPDLAEAPAPEAESASPPVEPPPPQVAEAPRPPATEPAAPRATPPPEDAQALDLPLPPPPAPAAPAAPRPMVLRDAPPQALAAARQAPPGAGAASEPPPGGGSRATGAVSPPGLLDGVRNPEPEYPLINRQRGDQGVVLVLLRVSETGQVVEVEVVGTSGHPALDASARQAAQRWLFRPAMRDGVPVAGTIRTAIHFRLR